LVCSGHDKTLASLVVQIVLEENSFNLLVYPKGREESFRGHRVLIVCGSDYFVPSIFVGILYDPD
jgi:hypothetical protein